MFIKLRSQARYAVDKIKNYEPYDNLDTIQTHQYAISISTLDGGHYMEVYPSEAERNLNLASLDKLLNKVEV